MSSTLVLDATVTVVGSASMVFEATGGSQGQPSVAIIIIIINNAIQKHAR